MPDPASRTLQEQAVEALDSAFDTAQELRDGIVSHGGPDLANEHNVHTGLLPLAAAAVRKAIEQDPGGLSELHELLLAALRARRGAPSLLELLESMRVRVPPHLAAPPERVMHLRVVKTEAGYKIEASNEANERREEFSRAFEGKFNSGLKRLQGVLAPAATGAGSRGSASGLGHRGFDNRLMKDLGKDVFNFLMPPAIKGFFLENLKKASDANTKLQVMLDVSQAPSLAHIPWELAFDERGRGHLCLRDEAKLCRKVNADFNYLRPRRELRLLGLAAARDNALSDALNEEPDDTLEADREFGLIRDALSKVSPPVELGWCPGGTLRDLRRMMDVRDGWSVFHFVGHGGFDEETGEGYLLLRSASGPVPVTADRLANALVKPGGTPQLVVLNCCSGGTAAQGKPLSSVAAGLVLSGIPAVIAMQFPVSEGAALNFTEHFYRAISKGKSVQSALTVARLELSDEFPEWVTPALFTSGADFALVEPPA